MRDNGGRVTVNFQPAQGIREDAPERERALGPGVSTELLEPALQPENLT